MKKKKLLFLTLNTFSATGGIEKVCRTAAKALHELTEVSRDHLTVLSMHDQTEDLEPRYLPQKLFQGFNGRRFSFVFNAIVKGREADQVIISHINLLPVAYLIKQFSPHTKLNLIAHGIEVWNVLPRWKRRMLQKVDLFLPVSEFTASKLKKVQDVPITKIIVLNNCLDPYLEDKADPVKVQLLKEKYGFEKDDFILFTLARLKSSEQYKGYDRVMEALAHLQSTHPYVKYMIVGGYDAQEKIRLDQIIEENNLTNKVVLTGYVPDEDLASHFQLSDAYIMPSKGEGFGIVFIEALYYRRPVIAGNIDGSVDALDNGRFGILVNPDNQKDIIAAIESVLSKKMSFIPDRKEVIKKFGFEEYKEKWKNIMRIDCEKQKPKNTQLRLRS
jgi:phosphatidyl-myo-inositol dimannoside synthase